jgi:carbon storage regulator
MGRLERIPPAELFPPPCLVGFSPVTSPKRVFRVDSPCSRFGLVTGASDHLTEESGIMLVLTRRQGEAIVINGDIQVSIVAVQGGKVRVGIEAPDWMTVDRQEIHERRSECGGRVQEPTGGATP